MTVSESAQTLLLVLVFAISGMVLPGESMAETIQGNDPGVAADVEEFATGGDGLSPETAVTFPNTADKVEGIVKERIWLDLHFPGYRLHMQSLFVHNGRFYDRMSVADSEGKAMDIYFDMTDWWGR